MTYVILEVSVPVPSVATAPAIGQGQLEAQSENITSELLAPPQAAENWQPRPLRRQFAVFLDDIDRPYAAISPSFDSYLASLPSPTDTVPNTPDAVEEEAESNAEVGAFSSESTVLGQRDGDST